MVFVSRQAKIDLDNIVIRLLEWKKIELTVLEVMQYVDDISDICYKLDNLSYHHPAKYKEHLKYGEYSHSYNRNSNTTWYIIYNIDLHNHIYVNKIISNYLTLS
jgi:mRNA-degrading endonuclease YafQ of YafQ-DinJ toxin-antitoxin module